MSVAAKIASGAYTPNSEWPIMSECVDMADYRKKRDVLVNERNKLLAEMKADLAKEHRINHVSRCKKELLWDLAVEYSRGNNVINYQDIATNYSKLVELVR